MTTEFTTALHDAEYRITLAQPELGNTLTLEAMRALAAEIRQAGRDGDVKLIRIRASGPAFCRGRALSAPPATPPSAAQFRRNVADPILDVYRAMHESEVPLLAEVQGDAEGFGCALVTACDLAIAADSARFSLPELQKNLPPTLVLSVLRHKVPPKASAHLVYLTETIDAANAREWGMVAEVVPGASLAERADAMVATICSRDRIAIATLKTYFREITIPDFSLASEVAGAALANAMTSMRR
ncbi:MULTISPECIES: enoyl-CoA hydratase/isomerase family protein [unclassified Burkholderia]|uniref:enoyl-CoA hydratase/isomerase family protein n=1 Tax=unclassified Burkholderia TaxID=2613784 RepID=UPI00141E3114|nr:MULTISPECIES: enoyl-CoA hydratase/isomerase family protein [unclassified Burkholderia]NIE84389.1 enoyl-CoA hydratase/isomerase family protein [Burkholderia sp. Tr-860]NIF62679.1 enoyl-CoA hydratase/isomerase family protein [Burkholderia sp. Cy-647]NIF94626.1 enoyl-CoA hydratase/isomerase family protein [Burkholderia sp. Ax-1720]